MGSIQNECIEEDRISNLPDSVISHILSFLPTKFMVTTCVLSHQWKDQWRSVANLDFDDYLPVWNIPTSSLGPPQHDFMDFFDNIMMNRDNSLNIDKFAVFCYRHSEENRLKKWVNLAMRQNVKEIILDFHLSLRFVLPRAIFGCETLVVLKLHRHILVNFLPSEINVSLPNLKILHLDEVGFAQYESLEMILNACPLLEEFMFREWWCARGTGLRLIGLPFLKKLTLNFIHGQNEFVVDVPSLEYLDFKDLYSDKFTMLNLGSLVHAKLDISQTINEFVSVSEYGERVLELLRAVSNVRSLTLCHTTMKALNNAHINNFPTFTNLTRLDLHADALSRWFVLPAILACTPILETLLFSKGLVESIQLQQRGYVLSWLDWRPPKNAPNGLLLHLKEIEIKNFQGSPEELIFISYFLRNAPILKRIIIHCHLSQIHNNIRETLQKFFTRSRDCCIIVK